MNKKGYDDIDDMKYSHSYHTGEPSTLLHTYINCPYCHRMTQRDFYGEVQQSLVIMCTKCNRKFMLGKRKRDAVRR